MRIGSKNRFSRLIIKKVRYNNTGITLKQDISIIKRDPSLKNLKPGGRTTLSSDYPEIAGAML